MADSNKKFVLCITDAFTKYAVVTAIQNKNAETVADTIFKEWFCKFGIPAQIHTDGGKEFVNMFGHQNDRISQCSTHQNLSSTPTVQFSSRGVQQNHQEIRGIICQ